MPAPYRFASASPFMDIQHGLLQHYSRKHQTYVCQCLWVVAVLICTPVLYARGGRVGLPGLCRCCAVQAGTSAVTMRHFYKHTTSHAFTLIRRGSPSDVSHCSSHAPPARQSVHSCCCVLGRLAGEQQCCCTSVVCCQCVMHAFRKGGVRGGAG